MSTIERNALFEINLADLWRFERSCFQQNSNKLSLDLSDKVLEKMANIQIEQTEPFIKQQFEGDKDYTYWKSKVQENRYSQDKDNPFYSDLIYTVSAFYTFESIVLIDSTEEDFHLWFALKLRHFEDELINVPGFLTYHLSSNFNSDLESFNSFLILVNRQYGNELFSKKIIDTVKDWINKNDRTNSKNAEAISKPRLKKSPRSIEGNFDSFLFDEKNKKLKEFSKDINEWTELVLKLKKGGFILRETKAKDFKNVFQNKVIDSKSRIIWKGSIKELQWFIKYFIYEKGLVESPGNDIWLLTKNCFVKKDGSEFTISQLSNANGKNLKRRDLLYDILNDYFE